MIYLLSLVGACLSVIQSLYVRGGIFWARGRGQKLGPGPRTLAGPEDLIQSHAVLIPGFFNVDTGFISVEPPSHQKTLNMNII